MATTSPSLLEQLKTGGSASVWNRFVQLYTPLLFYWVKRMGFDRTEAADVVQDVLMLLLVRMPEFEYDRQKSFRAWLRTITFNKCRDAIRRTNAREFHESQRAVEWRETSDSVFTDIEYKAAVARRALQLLKPQFSNETWEAAWQSSVTGRQAKDIADQLGMSVNSVYLAKARVLKKLREHLKGLWD
jgi:RNA polymerase sigma-70 factor, ECF subfamily